MNIKRFIKWETEKLPDILFRFMTFGMRIFNIFSPMRSRVQKLGVQKGATVIDYGSGPGFYVKPVSELTGREGQLYALDVHELAIISLKRVIVKHGLKNVEAVRIVDYSRHLPNGIADLVFSFDVIHMVVQPDLYFREMRRLVKPDGFLLIDRGHLPTKEARSKILQSGYWKIENEFGERFQCRPV